MQSMNDERFFDLALKVVSHQASDAERAELDALLSQQPELKAEFERLRADVGVAKEVLPLVNATATTAGELPAYARGRLQTKVRRTFGPPASSAKEAGRSLAWGWRWWLGLAAAAAVVVLLVSVFRTPEKPLIQVAMLDVAGGVRGGNDDNRKLLQQTWRTADVESFTQSASLAAWEQAWPESTQRTVAKVVYDRATGELRVIGKRGGTSFSKTFAVDNGLASALKQAKEYLEKQTRP